MPRNLTVKPMTSVLMSSPTAPIAAKLRNSMRRSFNLRNLNTNATHIEYTTISPERKDAVAAARYHHEKKCTST